MNKHFFKTFVVFGSILLFLLIKTLNLSIRFGDGNAYLYMAKMVSEGIMPYKDFFLADPPFLVLLLTGFRLIFKDILLLYQLIPLLFESGTAVLLYLLLKKWKNGFDYLAPLFYLFSFTVLSTSDYMTGVQVVVFFMMLAIYLSETDKPLLSGFAWSVAVLTKLYAAPALIGWLIYCMYKKQWQSLGKVIIGGLLGLGIILGPFLFMSWNKILQYLLFHQLHRPQGVGKGVVMFFFAKQEWFFILLTFVAVYFFRKKIIVLPFIFLLSFFLIFPDVYYTYLDTLMPFIVLLTVLLIDNLWKKHQDIAVGIFTVYFFFVNFSAFNYVQNYIHTGAFTNYKEIATYVETLPPQSQLYGSHELAPLIALQGHKTLFNNYIDTNPQAFSSGAQSVEKVSEEAVRSGIYLIARIYDYPTLKVKNYGFEGYFSKPLFDRYCKEMKNFPSTAREKDNYIKIFWCKKI